MYRRLIQMALEESASIDRRINQLEQQMADLLRTYERQIQRLAEVEAQRSAKCPSNL
jgi:hypothetical protein